MALKPFDQHTYATDDNAKQLVMDLFRHWGCTIGVNADDYGIDLVGRDPDGNVFGVEVEVKHNWHGPTFPFTTIHYAARKTKFIDSMHEMWFCTVNDDRTHCLLLSPSELDNIKLVRKQTSVTSTEWFLEFPIHLARIMSL